jgi:hypothetical protein
MLQGKPCDRCARGFFAPFPCSSELWRTKKPDHCGWEREGLREDALSRCGGCFKVSPAIAARSGLFRSLPSPKQAWLGQGAKKPGHFVAGPSLAEREGLPEAGFPIEGEASWKALRSLRARGLFRSLPSPKQAWLGQGAKKPGHFRGTGFLGGEGGIRTPGTLAGTSVFETDPIDHSGTSPIRGAKYSGTCIARRASGW